MASFWAELMEDRFDVAVVVVTLALVYLQHFLLSRSTRRHQEHTLALIASEKEQTKARHQIVAAMRLEADGDGDGDGGDDAVERQGGEREEGGLSRRGALGGSVAESEGSKDGGTSPLTFFDQHGYRYARVRSWRRTTLASRHSEAHPHSAPNPNPNPPRRRRSMTQLRLVHRLPRPERVRRWRGHGRGAAAVQS